MKIGKNDNKNACEMSMCTQLKCLFTLFTFSVFWEFYLFSSTPWRRPLSSRISYVEYFHHIVCVLNLKSQKTLKSPNDPRHGPGYEGEREGHAMHEVNDSF